MADAHPYIKPTETFRLVERGEGDGFPGPDYRINIVAERIAEALVPKIAEAVTEAKDYPNGFDMANQGDVLDFREGVIAGLQMALEQAVNDLPTEPQLR